MAHTSEQRGNLRTPLCGAKKKNGELCRNFAGEGTEHKGIGTCKFHGGATGTHQKHAQLVEGKRQMVTMGLPIEVQPHEALLNLLWLSAGHVAWLAKQVRDYPLTDRTLSTT